MTWGLGLNETYEPTDDRWMLLYLMCHPIPTLKSVLNCPLMTDFRVACQASRPKLTPLSGIPATLTYRLHVLLDRVNDIPLSFRPQFADRASTEYGQLARLTERGLQEALDETDLAGRLHTARLMGFRETAEERPAGRPRTRPPPRLDGLLAEMMVQVGEES